MKIVALIDDCAVIERVLRHLADDILPLPRRMSRNEMRGAGLI